MKRCGLFIKLALLFCAAISIVSALPASLAYMTASSNTVHNAFRVVYLPPQDISVPVRIHKTMLDLSEEEIGPEGFEFYLVDKDTGETAAATSGDDGWAVIDLTFTAEDVGKTYNYLLYERNTGREHVIYDDTVYHISITLTLSESHEMTAQLMVDNQPVTEIAAEYENQYDVSGPLPDTGDHARLLLWTAMLILSGAGLVVLRKNSTVFRRL